MIITVAHSVGVSAVQLLEEHLHAAEHDGERAGSDFDKVDNLG